MAEFGYLSTRQAMWKWPGPAIAVISFSYVVDLYRETFCRQPRQLPIRSQQRPEAIQPSRRNRCALLSTS
jgi:hypothetical protein